MWIVRFFFSSKNCKKKISKKNIYIRKIKEKYADTSSVCDLAFATTHLVGYNFITLTAAPGKAGFYENVTQDPQMIKATEHGIKYEDEAAAAYAVLRPDLAPFSVNLNVG